MKTITGTEEEDLYDHFGSILMCFRYAKNDRLRVEAIHFKVIACCAFPSFWQGDFEMANCPSLATTEHVVDGSGAEPSCRALENGQLQA